MCIRARISKRYSSPASPDVNQPAKVQAPAEELRLNTSTPVTPYASQKDLGVLAGDLAGFPNGRRPIDDVVDITLRVAMGVLLKPYDGSSDGSGSGVRRVPPVGLHRWRSGQSGQLPDGVPVPEYPDRGLTQLLRSTTMKDESH